MNDNGLDDNSFSLWDTMGDGTQALADAELIPILVKAIQEQSALITSLTDRIAALEA